MIGKIKPAVTRRFVATKLPRKTEKRTKFVGVAAAGWRILVDYRSSGCSVAEGVLVSTCFVIVHCFACETTFHGIQRHLNGSFLSSSCLHSDLATLSIWRR